MNRLLIATAALIGAVGFTSDAHSQIRVGPFGGVSVRVPFVSVDVLPFGGGTRVRAPFTSVGTGLYGGRYIDDGASRYGYGYGYRGYPRPYYYDPVPVIAVPVPVPAPAYPPYLSSDYLERSYVYPEPYDDGLGYSDELDRSYAYGDRELGSSVLDSPVNPYQSARPSVTSSRSLPDDLREAATRLARGLSRRRDDADVWLDYLRPDLIVDTIDQGGAPSELQTLFLNYEGLSGNSQLSDVWVVDGFRQTHQLLRQFLETAPEQTPAPSVPSGTVRIEAAEGDQEPTLAVPPKAVPDKATDNPADAPGDKPAGEANEADDLPVPRPTTSL